MSNLEDQFPTLRRILLVPPILARWLGTFARGFGRGLKRRWKPVAGLLILILVAHGTATFILERQVADELARIKSCGEPVFAVDLAGSPVPDSLNGALIYEKAFKLIPREAEWKLESSDAWDLLSEAKRNIPQTWKNAREAVAKHDSLFVLVNKALDKPKCHFQIDWNNGYDARCPHISRIRWLAKLVAIRAIVQAKDGDMSDSAESIGTLLKMCCSSQEDAILMYVQLRVQIASMASQALQISTEYGNFKDADAKRLANDFANIDLTPSFVTAMQGERAMFATLLSQIQKGGGRYLARLFSSPEPSVESLLSAQLYMSVGRPWFYRDQLHAMRYMAEHIKLASLPYREIRKMDIARLDEEPVGIIGAIICPVFAGSHRHYVDIPNTQAHGSAILLALLKYEQHFGTYPRSLSKLKTLPGFKLNLQDPFSGKDFVYKKIGDGFLLYSMGINCKDDGGMDGFTPEYRGIRRPSDRPDDIAWKIER